MADAGVVGMRYAHAFASVAEPAGLDAAQAEAQMRAFSGLLAESAELREVMADPSVKAGQKLAVLDVLAGRLGMFGQVRNFIAVILDHDRLGELDQIIGEYHAVSEQDLGVVEVEVTSARPMEGDDRAQMEFEVSKMAVSRVKVSYRENPALLGGAVVRIGSTVYDGSLRGQLEAMKRTLLAS